MNKILTFNVAEATELGTHCALHHSYSPQEQKYIFRLDVYNQKQIKMAISQNAHHGQLDLNGFEHIENMLRFEVPYRALEATKISLQQPGDCPYRHRQKAGLYPLHRL